ncbi:CS1 type fimbrial major subunit [Edaphovirga cremea]|uniref:CS1 type fimbrial major subunit n=1 Tax=Edaphovirga cremea TaxID=2267246 RepID=UPI003988C9FD
MKINKLALTIATGLLIFSGITQAQERNPSVIKTITITANISDSIYVSRPGGQGWYDTVSLASTDGTQTSFNSTIPVQVWSTTKGFNVSLVHPLEIIRTDSAYKMQGVNIKLAEGGNKGKDLSASGNAQTFTQKLRVGNGYEDVYQLQVNAKPPSALNNVSTKGSYSGDLVLLFEIPSNSI